jgi:hypothetical protein
MKRRIAAAIFAGAIASTLVASPAEAANPTLHFSYAVPNSPYSDTGSNTSLNAEWVRLKNSSTTHTYVLTGWTIRDRSSHVYKFPTYSLHPGESVTLHTGKGTSTHTNRYWQRGWYVWNNGGDTAYLRNSAGTQKDSCSWGSVGNGYKVTC